MATNDEVGVKLSLKDRKRFSSEADKAAADIKKIGRAADEANRSARSASSGIRSLSESTSGIRTVARYGAAAVATVTTGLGALGTAAGVFGVKTAAAFEQSEIGMSVLLKSHDKAMAMIGDLRAYAKDSPFGFKDVQTGAQRLLAMGFAAKDVMPTMKTLGNAAAGGIVPLEEGLWRLTCAFGQMKAAGRVQGDEIRQLEEMGIGVRKALSEGFGIPMKDLPKRIREGTLDGEKAIGILTAAINRDFGGMVDEQRKTWSGMWANLKETAAMNAGDTARAMMEPFKPAFANLGNWADRQGKKATAFAQSWGTQFKNLKASGVPTLEAIVWSLDDVTGAQGGVTSAFNEGKEIAQDVADVWKNSVWPAIQDLTSALGGKEGLLTPLGLVRDVLGWMADHPDAAKAIFEGAAIAITSWKLAQLIRDVTLAIEGMKLALAAPAGLVGLLGGTAGLVGALFAVHFALGYVYSKVNEGSSVWEGFAASIGSAIAGPGVMNLFTFRDTLKDIARWLGIIDGKKNVVNGVNVGPWASGYGSQNSQQGGGAVGAMASGGIVRSGGVSLVGERGPELLRLPGGSRVDPLPQDGNAPAFGGVVFEDGAIRVSGADVLHANRVADIIVAQIQDKLARA